MPYSKNRSTTRKLRKSKRGGQNVRRVTRVATYQQSKLPGSLSSPVIRDMTTKKPVAKDQYGNSLPIKIVMPNIKPKGAIKGGKTRKIRRKSQRKRQH